MPITSYDPRLDDEKYDDNPIARSVKDLYQLLNVIGLDDSNIAMKGVGVSQFKNPYKARAYRGVNYTFTDGAYTKINLNTESYDTNNNFDSTTDYRYVAPVSGYYQINGSVGLLAGGIAANAIALYIDGAIYAKGNQFTSGSTEIHLTVSDVVYMAAGSYVELWAFSDATSGTNTVLGGTAITFMSVYLLSL